MTNKLNYPFMDSFLFETLLTVTWLNRNDEKEMTNEKSVTRLQVYHAFIEILSWAPNENVVVLLVVDVL